MDSPKFRLTAREQQILGHIVMGLTDREIGRLLGVTHHTVNAFRKLLHRKLQARNVADLVRIAIQEKLVPL